jgi:hypothetical protein
VYVSGQAAVRDGRLGSSGRLGGSPGLRAQRPRPTARRGRLAEGDHAPGQDPGIRRRTPDFTSQPQVAGGASRLFPDVLGAAGAHARSATGADALPLGIPVEVEAIAEPGS